LPITARAWRSASLRWTRPVIWSRLQRFAADTVCVVYSRCARGPEKLGWERLACSHPST
jgi:hypothetical protein